MHPRFDDLLVADRSERGKLRFTGPQRGWFLHQIMTQSFEDIAVGEARDTAFITAHGRMRGFMETVATEQAILAHFELSLRATLPDEIRRYVFATQVAIEDATEEEGLVLVVGPGWRGAAAAIDGGVAHETHALGPPAGYVWVERAASGEAVARLERAGARTVAEEQLEEIRVGNGVPRWGHDMDFKTIPQEVGIDEVAVHYGKGCYVGQEAMAKIHLRGKVNRRLRRLELAGSSRPGTDVVVDGARAGVVTSTAGGRALAVLKHTVEPGQEVSVGELRGVVA